MHAKDSNFIHQYPTLRNFRGSSGHHVLPNTYEHVKKTNYAANRGITEDDQLALFNDQIRTAEKVATVLAKIGGRAPGRPKQSDERHPTAA